MKKKLQKLSKIMSKHSDFRMKLAPDGTPFKEGLLEDYDLVVERNYIMQKLKK